MRFASLFGRGKRARQHSDSSRGAEGDQDNARFGRRKEMPGADPSDAPPAAASGRSYRVPRMMSPPLAE